VKRLTPLVLALVLVLFAATVAPAQFFQPCPGGQCCPNGVCGLPQPSAPMFVNVPRFVPQAMPTAPQACYPVGECPCTSCTCAAGSCPGGCPTAAPAYAPAAFNRPLFPRVRSFAEGRPRLFRRGFGS
jgi:hypothetical protein